MTQFATLQLKNDAGTENSFAVQGINYTNGVANWSLAGTSYDAARTATFSLQQPTSKSTRARVKFKVAIPIMDPINALRKMDEVVFIGEFVLPKQSSLADRKDLRAYVADYLTDIVIVNAVNNFESVY